MVDAGLITADKSAALPLKKVSVIAEVKGYLFGLQASLFYQNDSSDPVEVLFRLPLERSTAVVGLTAVIDGRKITAQLQDKQKVCVCVCVCVCLCLCLTSPLHCIYLHGLCTPGKGQI